jgi:hypothetical protein
MRSSCSCGRFRLSDRWQRKSHARDGEHWADMVRFPVRALCSTRKCNLALKDDLRLLGTRQGRRDVFAHRIHCVLPAARWSHSRRFTVAARSLQRARLAHLVQLRHGRADQSGLRAPRVASRDRDVGTPLLQEVRSAKTAESASLSILQAMRECSCGLR